MPVLSDVTVSVVIPAFNESARVAAVVRAALQWADEVVVIDDGSEDETGSVAEVAGARVVRQENAGCIAAVKRGFREAGGKVVVTRDADGEHRREDITRLVEPILAGRADLALGARKSIDRLSERFLSWMASLRVKGVSDTGTGFRALRRDLAVRLDLAGQCICGVSVLEAASMGARIVEIPVELVPVETKRRIAWFHVAQFFSVCRWLLTVGEQQEGG